MNKKIVWQVLALIFVGIVLVFGTSAIVEHNQDNEQSVQQTSQNTVKVTIEGIYENKEVVISEHETVLGILRVLNANDSRIQLLTKEYSGLGTLVERIGNRTNGSNNEYWQYKVNGVMPQISADTLEIKDGDVVEWYFEKSEF